LAAQISENDVDPLFINNAHTMTGHPQTYKSPFTLDPKPMHMQVWQKATTGSVVSVGYVISSDRTFARYLTDSGHRISLQPVMTGFMTLTSL